MSTHRTRNSSDEELITAQQWAVAIQTLNLVVALGAADS